MSTTLKVTLVTAASVACLVLMLRQYPQPIPVADTASYLELAGDIQSLLILAPYDPRQLSIGSAIRTPGYPFLIALGRLLLRGQEGTILVMHLLLGTATLAAVMLTFQSALPILLLAALTLFAFFEMSGNFYLVQTEWMAFNALLLFACSLFIYLKLPSWRRAMLLGLLTGILPLIRPALVVALPVALAVAALPLRGRGTRRSAAPLAAFLAGTLPLLAWMSLNLRRLDCFCLSAFDGFNLFSVGAMIGTVEPAADDPADLQTLIQAVNKEKLPRAGEEERVLASLSKTLDARWYDHNTYSLALRLPLLQEAGIVRMNQMMRSYGLRSIRRHFRNYLRYVKSGLTISLRFRWLMLVSLFIVLYYRRRRLSPELNGTHAAMLALHVLHFVLVSAVQQPQFRYLNLTHYPYALLAVMAAAALPFGGSRSRTNGES